MYVHISATKCYNRPHGDRLRAAYTLVFRLLEGDLLVFFAHYNNVAKLGMGYKFGLYWCMGCGTTTFYEISEYKCLAGAYPLHDFYKIFRLYL